MNITAADARRIARTMAFGRIGLGASYLLTPGLALRVWPGAAVATGPVAKLLARSVGGRDLAIGLGTLLSLKHATPVRGWLEAGALADLSDAVAVAIAFKHLPRIRSTLMLALASGAVVASRPVIAQADQPASTG